MSNDQLYIRAVPERVKILQCGSFRAEKNPNCPPRRDTAEGRIIINGK